MAIPYTTDKQKLSKDCLFDAMMILLKSKNLDQISVTELAAKAGVSRMAFYRNYSVPSDILEEHILYNLCGGDLEQEYPKHVSHEKIWCDYYEYLRQNQQLIVSLLRSDMTQMLYNAIEAMAQRFAPSFFGVEFFAPYIMKVACSAIYALSLEWVKTGMKEPTSYMAQFTINILDAIAACSGQSGQGGTSDEISV